MKQSTDLAALVKLNIPWATGEGASYVREVPDASQIAVTPGAASWNDGFPPLTATAKASGGYPPSIQDMNGALRRLSGWVRYIMAAGVVPYDATWQGANSGYPLGAVVGTAYTGAAGTTGTLGRMWVSIVDGNTTNPDTGGAGWLYIPLPADVLALIQSTLFYGPDTSTTPNTITVAIPAFAAGPTVGRAFEVKIANTLTGASKINVNGVGLVTVTRADSTPTQAGDAVAGETAQFVFDGTNVQLQGVLTSALPATNIVPYVTPGTYTFAVPAGVTRIKRYRIWGAGGGSGGAYNGGIAAGAGGGGYVEGTFAVVPGQVLTIIVGTGGAAGNGSPSSGSAGGSSLTSGGAQCNGGGP